MFSPDYPFDTSNCEIPSDYLRSLIDKTANVKRYQDDRYPAGMITDNLFEHLCRLTRFASQLDLDPKEKNELLRMIWIHDLPETKLGDIPATLKSDGSDTEHDEVSVAEDILNDQDFELYVRMKTSADFLKCKDVGAPDKVGLIAKVLDSIDGNMYFHKHVHAWIANGNSVFEPNMDGPLKYTFKQYEVYINAVSGLEDESLREFLTDILNYQIRYIQDLWRGNENLIPVAMRGHIR